MPENSKPLVLLLAAVESSSSVLYGLYDVLYSVGSVFGDMTVGEPGPEALDVRIVAVDEKPFRCVGNVLVEPHLSIKSITAADVVIVCDMYAHINQPPRNRYPEETTWLKQMHSQGTLICSICTGALLLAEAGLLDEHETATHWAYGEMFRRYYPKVTMRDDAVLCLTHEKSGIITAGAVTAWQDLVLYLITRLCGKEMAYHTAKVFLISGHDEGQLPFAVMTKQLVTTDAAIADCQKWLIKNFAKANPVHHLVEQSTLNSRTLSRRFQAALGCQPIEYVQHLRIDQARTLLETTDSDIDEIAETVGYEDSASFRRLFKRLAGLTPAAYRRKFQRIGNHTQSGNQ
jgi:transcriptional regulator GlxA family with amidase domain